MRGSGLEESNGEVAGQFVFGCVVVVAPFRDGLQLARGAPHIVVAPPHETLRAVLLRPVRLDPCFLLGSTCVPEWSVPKAVRFTGPEEAHQAAAAAAVWQLGACCACNANAPFLTAS